jgi:hypothetical protein
MPRHPAQHFCAACFSGRYRVLDGDGAAEVMDKDR